MVPEQTEMFGGPWTEQKLERVTKYLQAYTTALNKQPFKLIYIDAFAGTGYRARRERSAKVRGLFPMPEKDQLVAGSARRALAVDPPFDKYIFIEKDKGRFNELKKLEDAFPSRRGRTHFINADANAAVVEICEATDWKKSRGVLFLDPYGMQVEWSTLEAVARTETIDLWLLFPIGVVNRLTPHKGPRVGWSEVLDRVLGDHGWYNVIYRKDEGFWRQSSVRRVGTNQDIETYIRRRLLSIFKGGVSERALPLYNRRGSCMFILAFACGNPDPKAFRLAHRIASHILKS